MKKVLLTATLVAFFGFAATAQEQGEIRAGAGLAFGTKSAIDEGGTKMGIGINIGGEYFATDVISVAPSYTFFFPSEISSGGAKQKVSYGAFNLDGRYYFGDGDVQFYGLAGLSFLSFKNEISGTGTGFDGTIKDSETGLNIGAGVMYPLGDGMFLNGQMKYQTPGEGQLVINAGIAFNIGG